MFFTYRCCNIVRYSIDAVILTPLGMGFGSRMMDSRKEQKLSREDLGNMIGTSSAIIGRYERDDMKPSIDISTKIAKALNVSLDFLVGNTSLIVKDKSLLDRIEDIVKMPADKKKELLNAIDA